MRNLLQRKSVIKVNEFLHKINNNFKLIVLDQTARTASDASKALNKETGSIIKSLLFKNPEQNEYYLCLVSGDRYLSINKLAKIVGYKIIKANADECKKFTGFSIGGVSPFAHLNKPKCIYIDESLKRYQIVYGAAGHPHVVFGIEFHDLVNLSKGLVVDLIE